MLVLVTFFLIKKWFNTRKNIKKGPRFFLSNILHMKKIDIINVVVFLDNLISMQTNTCALKMLKY